MKFIRLGDAHNTSLVLFPDNLTHTDVYDNFIGEKIKRLPDTEDGGFAYAWKNGNAIDGNIYEFNLFKFCGKVEDWDIEANENRLELNQDLMLVEVHNKNLNRNEVLIVNNIGVFHSPYLVILEAVAINLYYDVETLECHFEPVIICEKTILDKIKNKTAQMKF